MTAVGSNAVAGEWMFGSLIPGQYGVIVADPPWQFRSRTALQSTNWHIRRDAEKHYPVMGSGDIIAMPVRDLAAKDSHLFLWTTGPHLPVALEVIKAWGFRYSGIAFTWVKLKRSYNQKQLRILAVGADDLHFGLGHTTRKNAEFCLLGRRGNARRVAKNVREIILSPVREHSRKPEEFRDRVEAYVGPDIRIAELFARSPRSGWDSWGNQVDKFEGEA